MTASPMSLLTVCGELRWTVMLSGEKEDGQINPRNFPLRGNITSFILNMMIKPFNYVMINKLTTKKI